MTLLTLASLINLIQFIIINYFMVIMSNILFTALSQFQINK